MTGVLAPTALLFVEASLAPSPADRTTLLLSGTLAALEHLAMVLPLRLEGLWGLDGEESPG